ncbi:hypothetical protein HYV80_01955 [Candidatus Woesearchaeota archaeon]|nr:hypothetical protein [Candidatus Woesearchaeota archaeon]
MFVSNYVGRAAGGPATQVNKGEAGITYNPLEMRSKLASALGMDDGKADLFARKFVHGYDVRKFYSGSHEKALESMLANSNINPRGEALNEQAFQLMRQYVDARKAGFGQKFQPGVKDENGEAYRGLKPSYGQNAQASVPSNVVPISKRPKYSGPNAQDSHAKPSRTGVISYLAGSRLTKWAAGVAVAGVFFAYISPAAANFNGYPPQGNDGKTTYTATSRPVYSETNGGAPQSPNRKNTQSVKSTLQKKISKPKTAAFQYPVPQLDPLLAVFPSELGHEPDTKGTNPDSVLEVRIASANNEHNGISTNLSGLANNPPSTTGKADNRLPKELEPKIGYEQSNQGKMYSSSEGATSAAVNFEQLPLYNAIQKAHKVFIERPGITNENSRYERHKGGWVYSVRVMGFLYLPQGEIQGGIDEMLYHITNNRHGGLEHGYIFRTVTTDGRHSEFIVDGLLLQYSRRVKNNGTMLVKLGDLKAAEYAAKTLDNLSTPESHEAAAQLRKDINDSEMKEHKERRLEQESARRAKQAERAAEKRRIAEEKKDKVKSSSIEMQSPRTDDRVESP